MRFFATHVLNDARGVDEPLPLIAAIAPIGGDGALELTRGNEYVEALRP